MPSTPAPQGEQLLYTVNEACDVLRVGRTKIYELMGDGRLPFAVLDGRRRVFGEHVRQLLAALPQGAQPAGRTPTRRKGKRCHAPAAGIRSPQ